MNSLSKRHHIIPISFQKRFIQEGETLYAAFKTDKGFNPITKSKPENLYVRKHIYSKINKNGTKDDEAETYFANRIEGPALSVIDKIIVNVRQNKIPSLNENERKTWNSLYYNLWKRTKSADNSLAIYGDFDELYSKAISHFETTYRPLLGSGPINFLASYPQL